MEERRTEKGNSGGNGGRRRFNGQREKRSLIKFYHSLPFSNCYAFSIETSIENRRFDKSFPGGEGGKKNFFFFLSIYNNRVKRVLQIFIICCIFVTKKKEKKIESVLKIFCKRQFDLFSHRLQNILSRRRLNYNGICKGKTIVFVFHKRYSKRKPVGDSSTNPVIVQRQDGSDPSKSNNIKNI